MKINIYIFQIFKSISIYIFYAFLLSFFNFDKVFAITPDIILYGGTILTIDSHDKIAEAVSIKNDKILTIGKSSVLLSKAKATTKLINLNGKTLIPGFIAAHEHPALDALYENAVNLSGFKYRTNNEVMNELKKALALAQPGKWLYGVGLDLILTPDLEPPTRKILDAISPPNTPVVLISQTLHSVWVNSKALELLGITKETKDPSKQSYYQRDQNGELTGYIIELTACAPFLKELNLPKNIATKYAQVLDKLLNYGFTTVSSLGYSLPLESAKKLSYKNSEPRIRQFIYLTENELNYLPSKVDHSDPFFRVQGIKLWHDGSPYTGNMFISSLYMDSKLNKDLGITPGTHGEPALTTEYLIQKIKYFSSKGWQIAIHTQGDASNKAVYDAIEKVGEIPKNAGPIRIEHLVMLPKDLLKSFALKGVTTSFHINHILYYGDALKNSIVGSAIDTALPVKAAFESNMHPTLHADSPMFSPEPFSLMKTAITRKTNSGATINPEQAITIQQAMRALTINGAYQLGIEKNAGSLEPNKWADFVILSNNPYEVPVDKLSEITIDSVYVAGKKKY